MKLIIESDSEITDIFEGLELLTNAAQVTLSSIAFDESRTEISIPMRRRSYERRRFFLIGERYKLVSHELIECTLVIKEVVAHQIEDNLHLPNIQLLFGVNVKNKVITLCSAEEKSGVTAFKMAITVRNYDIELRDRVEHP